jgi:RNA polymerase sigma-70 factor (ECF subfamily)
LGCDDVTGEYAAYSIAGRQNRPAGNRARRGIKFRPGVLIPVDDVDYEQAVALYHEDLHRFALSLARNPDDACDLTQESYCRLLTKSDQLRDRSKIKSWLFTTLYRVFLGRKRHEKRFPHSEISVAEPELPAITPDLVDKMDGAIVMEALNEIDEHHRTPLVLFYLQSLSYREIAELLDVPVGTVMSRLSRAKVLLRSLVTARAMQSDTNSNIIPLPAPRRIKT